MIRRTRRGGFVPLRPVPSGDESGDDESGDEVTPPDSAKVRSAARHTAIGLLARREHAQAEVRRKLRDRGFDRDTTNEVVDELTRQRLLSDDRFTEAFIRSRAERGQGPVRLRAELRQLQVTAERIESHLKAADIDWDGLAQAVRLRKFGSRPVHTLTERAKQVRFLQYRGFTAVQIRAALGGRCEDDLLESDEGEPPDPDPES